MNGSTQDSPLDREEEKLSLTERPGFEGQPNPVSIVDLFAGCGGLTLGAAQAAASVGRGIDVRLAVEYNATAAGVFKTNFPHTRRMEVEDVLHLFSGDPGNPLSRLEKELAELAGALDILVGGPPCQGHSNLNNHTRGNDPKNALYAVMARAAEVLQPRVVVIENVPAVLNDRFDGRNAVAVVREQLVLLGYDVHDSIISLHELGVAQKRKRHVMLAIRRGHETAASIFRQISSTNTVSPDLRWAIGDLIHANPTNLFDRTPKASKQNLDRMNYLLEHEEYDLPNSLRPKCHQGNHSYKSMYGRLKWNQPAQTVTSGYGSIGQGRYMHPEYARALTPHEAARIQGFPDYFDFSMAGTRSELATMIGNAVPPQLTRTLLRYTMAKVCEETSES